MNRFRLLAGLACLVFAGCGGGAATEGFSPGTSRDVRYLFDSQGDWVALQAGNLLYDNQAKAIGWVAPESTETFRRDGSYIGSLTSDDRLLKLRLHPWNAVPVWTRNSNLLGRPEFVSPGTLWVAPVLPPFPSLTPEQLANLALPERRPAIALTSDAQDAGLPPRKK